MLDEKQMSFFEEGGMSAPETEVDSSSGNEVPPGSLPEEVRDDVDAQLSSGEYVVPADVVRYFGMKFFEDLRETAKNDLEKMDSEGRIGGEPMTDQEGTPEGLSEQEMALLQEIMSEGGEPQFNEGGTVEGQYRRLSDVEDITKFRNSDKSFRNTAGQKERLKSSYGEEGKGGWLKEKYPFMVGGLMGDKFFRNEPSLLDNEEGSVARDLSSTYKDDDRTFLENFAAEMRELSDREMEGVASEEELDLLRAYQNFFTPRTGFNQGGVVQSSPNMSLQNPEFYPQTDKGFAEGGLAETPKFNADSWRDVGSSFFNSQSSVGSVGVGTYYKTYVGPNGETRLILFVDGEPSTPIPEGFTEQKSAASEVQEEQAKEDVKDFTDSESDQRRREREENRRETKSWAEQNYESVTSDPVGFGLEKLQGNNEMFGKAAEGLGAFGGPMGIAGAGIAKAAQMNNLAEAKAAKLQAKAMGLDTTELDQAIEEFDNKLGPVDDIANALGIATGERYYESLREYTPSEVSETDMVFKSSRTPEEAENRVQEIGKKLDTRDDTMAGARTFGASNTEGTVTNVGDKDTDPTEDTYGISVRSGSAAPQTGSTRPQSRPPGMNKGGLVKRRKKTPKKKTTKT